MSAMPSRGGRRPTTMSTINERVLTPHDLCFRRLIAARLGQERSLKRRRVGGRGRRPSLSLRDSTTVWEDPTEGQDLEM